MMKIGLRRGSSIAIDLGNNNTVLTDKRNILLSQPSFIALHGKNNSVKAVGDAAYDMLGKSHEDLRIIKPMKGGVIADYNSASKMLKALIKLAFPNGGILSGFDNIVTGTPFSTTEVERRALRDALGQFNSNNTYLLFEPLAAAIGMGLDIREPDGKFLIDIGGGITEAVLISLSGVVTYNSVKIAGDSFDEDIQDYFRRAHNLDVGIKTAEFIKIRVGAASLKLKEAPEPLNVIGKDLMSGIPRKIVVKHEEIAMVLNNSILKIEQAIIQTLEECPPELAGDVYENGIFLTGGGSLLRGLKERIQQKTKLPVHQDSDALLSVTRGISTVLKSTKKYAPVLFK